jgi:sugar diacid utilization regulator
VGHSDFNRLRAHLLLKCTGNGFELGPTANALKLHVSTLRYRLQRLRTAAGLDWSSACSRLEIEVATMLEKWHRNESNVNGGRR